MAELYFFFSINLADEYNFLHYILYPSGRCFKKNLFSTFKINFNSKISSYKKQKNDSNFLFKLSRRAFFERGKVPKPLE